ncbi:MAG: hypothetical protein ACFWUA_01170 [Sporanaerobacter sp.]|jgi:predicted transcriptional regulator|uniref:ABC transporter C-terminal domain-containing protein n=1 Tax=Sporanaerobacter sp. TaxID=2010183 RepID=UPI003A1037C4
MWGRFDAYPAKVAPPKQPKKPSNKFKIAKVEEEIFELEDRLKNINEEMASNNDNAEKLYELFQEKESLESQLKDSYELWESLQS